MTYEEKIKKLIEIEPPVVVMGDAYDAKEKLVNEENLPLGYFAGWALSSDEEIITTLDIYNYEKYGILIKEELLDREIKRASQK